MNVMVVTIPNYVDWLWGSVYTTGWWLRWLAHSLWILFDGVMFNVLILANAPLWPSQLHSSTDVDQHCLSKSIRGRKVTSESTQVLQDCSPTVLVCLYSQEIKHYNSMYLCCVFLWKWLFIDWQPDWRIDWKVIQVSITVFGDRWATSFDVILISTDVSQASSDGKLTYQQYWWQRMAGSTAFTWEPDLC